MRPAKDLLTGSVDVIHLGIDSVADAPRAAGAPVTQVDFLPPAGGDPERIAQLDRLLAPPTGPAIDADLPGDITRQLNSAVNKILQMPDMVRLLAHIRDQGKTIFVVTHQASLLEGVADEFVWMEMGKIVARTATYHPGGPAAPQPEASR